MAEENGHGTPGERALRAMSHRKLKQAAKAGNKLAQKILAEMSKDAGRKATKAIKKARKKTK